MKLFPWQDKYDWPADPKLCCVTCDGDLFIPLCKLGLARKDRVNAVRWRCANCHRDVERTHGGDA